MYLSEYISILLHTRYFFYVMYLPVTSDCSPLLRKVLSPFLLFTPYCSCSLCRFAPGPSVVFAAVALAVCRGAEVGEHAKGADGESVY